MSTPVLAKPPKRDLGKPAVLLAIVTITVLFTWDSDRLMAIVAVVCGGGVALLLVIKGMRENNVHKRAISHWHAFNASGIRVRSKDIRVVLKNSSVVGVGILQGVPMALRLSCAEQSRFVFLEAASFLPRVKHNATHQFHVSELGDLIRGSGMRVISGGSVRDRLENEFFRPFKQTGEQKAFTRFAQKLDGLRNMQGIHAMLNRLPKIKMGSLIVGLVLLALVTSDYARGEVPRGWAMLFFFVVGLIFVGFGLRFGVVVRGPLVIYGNGLRTHIWHRRDIASVSVGYQEGMGFLFVYDGCYPVLILKNGSSIELMILGRSRSDAVAAYLRIEEFIGQDPTVQTIARNSLWQECDKTNLVDP